MKLSITDMPLKDIHLLTRALKEHSERQIEQIKASIQAFGFNDPIAVDEAGTIIEGTGRVLAAKKLGMATIPTIVLQHLSEAQKKAYRIAHNKIALNTGFDLDALKAEFESLCQLDGSLMALTGFEALELEDLLKLPEIPELAPELTESLSESKSVTCPHCGGVVHVLSRLTVISLFAGCGGSSLGYKMAGCDMLAAIERDSHAVSTYRANHPGTLLLDEDITQLDPNLIMTKLNLKSGELDILDGSPPCQGFSLAGARQVNDPRNRLFLDYIRFLQAFQPKAFVMENVPGLVSGKMQSTFQEIIQALTACGYTVQARVLNAAHYGVPQARKRLIILGIRNDLNIVPKHPQPATLPISFREATRTLYEMGLIQVPVGRALAIARALQAGESGAHLHQRFQQKGHDFSLIRLHWHKPSPTVCKTIRPGQCGLLHPVEDRFLSIGELKRVCSFPDDFQLSGPFEQQWGRLGNAVPPLLMKAIAESLSLQLKGKY